MPRRRRTPLPLHPRGSFVFTERTTTIEVPAMVASGTGPKRYRMWLHVGRSRGALEYFDVVRKGRNLEHRKTDTPAVEVDAATVLSMVDMVNEWRKTARGLGKSERDPVVLDPGVLSHLRTTARKSPGTTLPLEGRPRRCYETGGVHPSEWLWIDTTNGDSVIETRTPVLDARGDVSGFSSTSRPVTPQEAVKWLKDEGEHQFPHCLMVAAKTDVGEVLWGPREPFELSRDPRPTKKRRSR